MTKQERLGLLILNSEMNKAKFHTQRIFDEYSEEQIEAHLNDLNKSYEVIFNVLYTEMERNKKKIKFDLEKIK